MDLTAALLFAIAVLTMLLIVVYLDRRALLRQHEQINDHAARLSLECVQHRESLSATSASLSALRAAEASAEERAQRMRQMLADEREKAKSLVAELERKMGEIIRNPPKPKDEPLGAIKIRRADFMASSWRGLLLHASLCATGGEAHRRMNAGEVLLDGAPITDPESAPVVARSSFVLKCGEKSSVITVIE